MVEGSLKICFRLSKRNHFNDTNAERRHKAIVRDMVYYKPLYQEKVGVQIPFKILFKEVDIIAVSIKVTIIACSEPCKISHLL